MSRFEDWFDFWKYESFLVIHLMYYLKMSYEFLFIYGNETVFQIDPTTLIFFRIQHRLLQLRID